MNFDSEPIAPTIAASATAQPASWSRLLMVALPIVLSGSLIANAALPLLLRGVSAIVCGLAVLLCGPYLMSHALVAWARRNEAATQPRPILRLNQRS